MARIIFVLLIFSTIELVAQSHIPGIWEGVIYDDSTDIKKEIKINILIPSLKKDHRCGYEEAVVKALIQEAGEDKFREFYGILSFDCYSINLYSTSLYDKDATYFKGYLYRNDYDDYLKKDPFKFTKMQLILKKGNPYGYWQKGVKDPKSGEVIHKTGKIIFEKNKPLKRA